MTCPAPEETSGCSPTPWLSSLDGPRFPVLSDDLDTDVCIVGGGIAGLTTAYLLGQEGRRVVLLEDGGIGSGETGRTTAHLASALDDRFCELERLHGERGAATAYQSHAMAIDQIEFIIKKHRIACDFERVDGYLFNPPGEPPAILTDELACARRIGIPGVRPADRVPLEGFETGPCLVFPHQGQFHPTKYLTRLAEVFVERGGRIFERSHVEDVEAGPPARVTVRGGRTVTAASVVVATNAPVVSRVSVPLRQYAYRTYVIALRIPRGSVEKALYWDTADPYHYVRIQTDGAHEFLIVGGEDHKTGQPGEDDAEERYRRLELWAQMRFGKARNVEFRWSGQIMEPADCLAYIGRHEAAGPNVYIATGDSGHGMTHGTIAGMVIRDLILGRENPWASLYDPGRLALKAVGEVARENLKVLPQYGKWLTPGDVRSTREIPRGEGRIVRSGLKKIACYRDEAGRLHATSAACPHLGGPVCWNGAEKTWDCPAHGSRFSARGEVLNGPANTDLKGVPLPKPRRRRRAVREKAAAKKQR